MARPKAPPIDLTEFETHVRVRPMRIEDFPRIVELAEACFPGMAPWTRDQIESQLRTFPEGQLVVEYDEDVVASSSSLIVDFDDYEDWQDWKVIADNGYIRNHDAEGDSLYGIEIMVDPDYRGLKLARRLYEARKALCRERNLRRIIVGGRIPGYGKHAEQMSAGEYVEEVLQRNIYDPVLTTQLANGFHLARLIPNYFPSDGDSRGYATFLVWNNIEYAEAGSRRPAAAQRVRACLVQYRMRAVRSWDDFAKQVRAFVDIASGYASDLTVFPELFTTQLLAIVEARAPAEAARKLADHTPRYLELLTDLAVSYNVNIVGGSQFTLEEGRLYNVAYLFRRDGTIGKQYKIHVTPAERKWWGVNPGRKVEVFDTDRGRLAILVGEDVVFPELARIATARGADLIVVPYTTDERYGYLRVRHCAQARAIENQLYTAIAGSAGLVPFVDNVDLHYAQSAIFTPADFSFAPEAVAGDAMPNVETVVVHDLDLELLRRNRQTGTVRPWTDRERGIYGIRYQDPDEGAVDF
jgi:predicted amidohydrolase/GNAT superfamily N-acetyltransferase